MAGFQVSIYGRFWVSTEGENHATHMLYGMPYASTMGLGGSPVRPMIIPFEERPHSELRIVDPDPHVLLDHFAADETTLQIPMVSNKSSGGRS